MSKLSCSFILLSLSFSLSAQNILQTQVESTTRRWSGTAKTGYSSNLEQRNSVDSKESATGELLLNYRVSGQNLLRAVISGTQEQTQGRESKLRDSQLAWVNNEMWFKNKVWFIGQQVRAILPTNRDSYLRDEKLLGVTLVPTFVANLTPIGLSGVNMAYTPQLTKNFHKYEQSRAYKSNTSHSARHVIAISWSVTDTIFLAPALVYAQSWTYGNSRKDDAFEVYAEGGYVFTPSIILAVGMTNSGTIKNFEQGNDQSIELFNNRTASVYSELTYAF